MLKDIKLNKDIFHNIHSKFMENHFVSILVMLQVSYVKLMQI